MTFVPRFNELSIRSICLVVILITCPIAAIADHVSISGLDNITVNTWAGATGNLQGSDTYCVRSCTGSGNSCQSAAPYDVAAYSSGQSNSSGHFFLSRNGGGSQPALRVIFEWSAANIGPVVMSNYNVTGFVAPTSGPNPPGATNCNQANSQNTIRITVPASELATAAAGTYSETFGIDACRLTNWTCTGRINFTVNIPELIQITKLQNFTFGAWSGIGNIQSIRDFCVFRNGSGGFSINSSGSNNSGGRFRVSSGSSGIPYQIEFSDGGAWYAATPGTTLNESVTGFAGGSVRDCGGGTNHRMRVTMLEADLASSPSGNYSDTVTISVQPE